VFAARTFNAARINHSAHLVRADSPIAEDVLATRIAHRALFQCRWASGVYRSDCSWNSARAQASHSQPIGKIAEAMMTRAARVNEHPSPSDHVELLAQTI